MSFCDLSLKSQKVILNGVPRFILYISGKSKLITRFYVCLLSQ